MGKMTRCAEGHFFDSEKHQSCPWCAPTAGGAREAVPPPIPDRTKKLNDSASGGAAASPPAPAFVPPPPKPEAAPGSTKRLDSTEAGTRPVVGWLVCIEGPDRGKDYRLHAEKNFIGRDSSMDICLARDESVSRSKHAIFVFDPKKRNYWLYPGDAQGLVYLREELVNTPMQVGPYEVIEVGSSKLVLVPFDTERYPL
jgi:hypothetical protein